jgi:AI-2 transport protein TqsA
MQRTQTICLVILATIAVGFSLFYLKSVLLPFVIALFIVIGCRPILNFMETKLKLSRYVGFFVTFSIGTILLVMFLSLTWLSINDLTRNLGAYETRLNAISQWVSIRLESPSAKPDARQTGAPQIPEPQIIEPQDDVSQNDVSQDDVSQDDVSQDESPQDPDIGDQLNSATDNAKQAINAFFASTTEYLKRQLLQIAGSLSSLLSYGILILIFVFFLLIGQDGRQQNQPGIVREIESQIRRYLIMKTFISAVTGFAFGLVLWLFGVPLAILFGFLAFLLNFIPNIGPLISMLTPVPFLLLNSEMSPTSAILCFLLVATIQFVSGNVIETRIMGKSFDVSPVVLLLALMFFGLVWGIIGMFMATPIASIFKIVLQQNQATRPLGELMAGRWTTQNRMA